MDSSNQPTYKVLLEGAQGEITEKKSRFIATVRVVTNEEEAQAFIAEMKKKYWDARHNCYAYIVGDNGEITRCSDDGEPSGTAGRPMLEVLTGENVRNIAVVVTRYFGGVLLGTGGLVRAYGSAVKAGLENCRMGTKCFGLTIKVVTDYNGIGKILYCLSENGVSPQNTDYGESVSVTFEAPEDLANRLMKEITEATAGRAEITEENRGFILI